MELLPRLVGAVLNLAVAAKMKIGLMICGLLSIRHLNRDDAAKIPVLSVDRMGLMHRDKSLRPRAAVGQTRA